MDLVRVLRASRVVLLTAVIVGLIAGCSQGGGSSSSGGSSAGEITVTATDLKFDPTSINVKAGQPVTIRLVNRGAIEHDLKLVGIDGEPTAKAAPGANATVTFTPSKTGTFDFICSIPGHKEAGMVGKLVVN